VRLKETLDIQTLRNKLQHNQERRAWFVRELARRTESGLDVARERRWLAVYERECSALARMLRAALAAEQDRQAAAEMALRVRIAAARAHQAQSRNWKPAAHNVWIV